MHLYDLLNAIWEATWLWSRTTPCPQNLFIPLGLIFQRDISQGIFTVPRRLPYIFYMLQDSLHPCKMWSWWCPRNEHVASVDDILTTGSNVRVLDPVFLSWEGCFQNVKSAVGWMGVGGWEQLSNRFDRVSRTIDDGGLVLDCKIWTRTDIRLKTIPEQRDYAMSWGLKRTAFTDQSWG